MPEGTAFAPPELTNPPRLSPALLSEHPLILDPLLAQVTGNPDNAIILNQLYYWSQQNRTNPDYQIDGVAGVTLTYDQWVEHLGGMYSRHRVIRAFKALREQNLIIEQEMPQKNWSRRAVWRTVNRDRFTELYREHNPEAAAAGDYTPFFFQRDKVISVYPTLVKAVGGLGPAALLQQIHFWLLHNHRKGSNIRNGRVWMYRSQAEWISEDFPWIKKRHTITAYAQALTDAGLILIDAFNKSEGDHRHWYTIDYDAVENLYRSMQLTEMSSGTPMNTESEQKRPIGSEQKRPIGSEQKRPIGSEQKRPISSAQKRPISSAQKRPIQALTERPIYKGTETRTETRTETSSRYSVFTAPAERPLRETAEPAASRSQNPKTQNPEAQDPNTLPKEIDLRIKGDLRTSLFKENRARKNTWASLTDEQVEEALNAAQEKVRDPYNKNSFNTHFIRALDELAFPNETNQNGVDPSEEGILISFRTTLASAADAEIRNNPPPGLTYEEIDALATERYFEIRNLPLTEIARIKHEQEQKAHPSTSEPVSYKTAHPRIIPS